MPNLSFSDSAINRVAADDFELAPLGQLGVDGLPLVLRRAQERRVILDRLGTFRRASRARAAILGLGMPRLAGVASVY